MTYPASPDEAPPGALLGGEVAVVSVLPLGGAVQPHVSGPSITVALTVSLAYMGATGVDVAPILAAVKSAVATFSNETVEFTAADVEGVCTAVPGVAAASTFFGPAATVNPSTGAWQPAGTGPTTGGPGTNLIPAAVTISPNVRIVP